MRVSKSPFKDNKELISGIRIFLSRHRATFSQQAKRTSSYFELAVYNDVVRFYETNGYTVAPENLQLKRRQFVYALSTSAKPSNCSYFRISKSYKNGEQYNYEIRHNLRIQSAHDDEVFVSPDYSIVEQDSIAITKVKHYYNGKADYYFAPASSLKTFAETKHYAPGPELVLNFVGLVNELMPCLMHSDIPEKGPKHFGPALFVSGVGNSHLQRIKTSLSLRYKVNVFLGLFAYPSQLYSTKNQVNIDRIGSKSSKYVIDGEREKNGGLQAEEE